MSVMATVIESAGGLLWRMRASTPEPEVLLIHRRAHDDWSFPKGRRQARETVLACAIREVAEETGMLCSVGEELPEVTYTDRKGRTRRVRYWTMRVVGGAFMPNDEVDDVVWCSTSQAAERLTSPHDQQALLAWRTVDEQVA